VERFNVKKLNDVDVRKQYQIKVSNRFRALLKNESEHIIGVWDIEENMKTSAKQSLGLYELKQH